MALLTRIVRIVRRTPSRALPASGRDAEFEQPSLLAATLDPATLTGHFVLGRLSDEGPHEWLERRRGEWCLRHESSLPVVDIHDTGGVHLGWLLGHGIDTKAQKVLRGTWSIPASVDGPDLGTRVEQALYSLGGRWVGVVLSPAPRVYPDSIASLPVLFDQESGLVASSPFLLPRPDGRIPDSPLVPEVGIYRTGRYFPLSATCHATARRLLPSHVLDLSVLEQRRIWPRSSFTGVAPADAAARIGELLEATITGATVSGKVCIPLTAGGDSRMLLACARSVVDAVTLVTVRHPDTAGRTDTRVAARIASDLGLEHRVAPWVAPSDTDVKRWLTLTGASTGEYRGRRAAPSFAGLGKRGLCLKGLGVEVARGRKWQAGDHQATPLTPASLFAGLQLPDHPSLLRLGADWLAEAPELGSLDLIDLFYLENRHGVWGGPLTFGYPETFEAVLYPFAHREVFELVFSLPIEYRRADRLRADLIAARWPELTAYPVNRTPLRYAAWGRASRVVQMPRGAVRRVGRRAQRARRTA